ncbi:hypothetical protein ACIQGZ_25950 [Streptomyces sp. NPDC092296]|uniref:hypothetical protein n=1 Tax=Streptomyces sp. NPDC092296 TaxID=3366012 RepID=UPI0038098A74
MGEHAAVVMLCGIAGSGKATYAQALERQGHVRLSIDEAVWTRIGHDAAEPASGPGPTGCSKGDALLFGCR